MILYVNEKLFSIHRKFHIKDEYDNNVYEISSKVLSLGDKTTITDMSGNEIAYIEQEIFHLTPHYNIYIGGNKVCHISKKIQLIKNDYVLDNGYMVTGNFLSLNFEVYNETGGLVGTIERKFISIGDKYVIDIKDESKLNLILSIIVAISNDINRAQSNNSNNN